MNRRKYLGFAAAPLSFDKLKLAVDSDLTTSFARFVMQCTGETLQQALERRKDNDDAYTIVFDCIFAHKSRTIFTMDLSRAQRLLDVIYQARNRKFQFEFSVANIDRNNTIISFFNNGTPTSQINIIWI